MKKIIPLLVLLIFSCKRSTEKEKIVPFAEEEKNYTEAYNLSKVWLKGQLDYESIPGLTMSVVQNQRIDWSIALGISDDQTALKQSSLFSICSISKLFTSIAIMQLVENGKIKLGDPISMYLPFFNLKQLYSESRPITIANILTHSSGLPRESNHPYWSQPNFNFPSKEDVIGELAKQETLYPADKYYQYSNLGLALLGYVVEEVSKQSYDDYIEENIINPIGMDQTRTFMDIRKYGADLVFGYSSKKRDGSRDLVPFFNANGIDPAAGFSSNSIDLAKFALWQLNLLSGIESPILKAETLKKMHTTQLNDTLTDVKRGYGFGIYGEDSKRRVGHGGSCPGYRSVLSIDTKKNRAFAVMINANGTNPSKYANGVSKILDEVNLKKDQKPHKFADVEGFYNVQPWGGESYLSSWGDEIALLSIPNQEASFSRFKQIEEDHFRRILKNDSLGEALYILRNSQGRVTGFKRHQNIYEYISDRR